MSTQPLPLPETIYPAMTMKERVNKARAMILAYGDLTGARDLWLKDQLMRILCTWEYEGVIEDWHVANPGKTWNVGVEPAKVRKAMCEAYSIPVRKRRPRGKLAEMSDSTASGTRPTYGTRV